MKAWIVCLLCPFGFECIRDSRGVCGNITAISVGGFALLGQHYF